MFNFKFTVFKVNMSSPVKNEATPVASDQVNQKTTPESSKPAPSEQRTAESKKSGNPRNAARGTAGAGARYQPKLMLEENEDTKSVLIKIGGRTSTRQIINYALSKVRQDWKITLNAFQLDMTKALQAAEIIKTRLPFLHQENKLLSYQATHHIEGTDGKPGRERHVIRTGIAIALSRNAFEVQDLACYQKPKPRQFVQPAPRG